MATDTFSKKMTDIQYEQRENNIHHPPYEQELSFFQMIKTGNIEELSQHRPVPFSEQVLQFGTLSRDQRRNALYHLIITIAMMARFCIDGGLAPEDAFSRSDAYILLADQAQTIEELDELHTKLVDKFAKLMKELKTADIHSPKIIRCIDYIRDNLHEKITLPDAASHVELSQTYLSNLFKKETKKSFSHYVRRERIEYAKMLLRYTSLPLAEIACTLAFNSQSHFTQAFRKETGKTPKQYRDKNYRHV